MRVRIGGKVATVFVFLLVGASASGVGDEQEEAPSRPRSVLFYLIDTCRADRIGFNGYERPTTPFLKWLAKRSVVFESCFAQAPWTKPSMASMLSSRYPSQTGVYRMMDRLPEPIVTWPEVLQANGLYTAGFSTNIVMGNLLSNYAQGFDHFVESTRINGGDPIENASGSSRKLNQHAFRWLERTDHWPMLLYMHSVDPHEEYEPEAKYLRRFADPQRHARFREEWEKLVASRPRIPGLHVTQQHFDATQIDAESFIQHGSNLYDADLLANDDQMERLWNKLQEQGWGEDFIFVFTSDHGEEFFDHGGTSHGYSLYNEMVRVPLMIYAPGLVPEGTVVRTPVRSLDIYPTLCELLGFDTPEEIEGESLIPLMRAAQGAARWGDPLDDRLIFSEHREDPGSRRVGLGSGVMISLRAGPWKFILNQRSSQLLDKPRFELYDLEEDPAEQDNVADQYPELVRQFELKVATFVGDNHADESLGNWIQPDPEILEQLRNLGYLSQEEIEKILQADMDKSPSADLWAALASQDLEKLGASLDAGADPNQKEAAFGISALSMAATFGQAEMTRMLLDAGAEVDARNQDGATALISAAFFGHDKVLEILLDAGADRAAENQNGDSALSVTKISWEMTKMIGDLVQLKLDRKTVESGRSRCAKRLNAESKD